MAGRFVSQKDINLFNTINKELVGDPVNSKDGVINQEVVIYKVDVYETTTNIYGESSSGRTYKKGVKLNCIIDAEDFDFETTEFGPDLNQNATFSFLRQSLIDAGNVVPDIGDVINWNYTYWEVSAINENQLLGGMQENNHSVVLSAYLTEPTRLNIQRLRSS